MRRRVPEGIRITRVGLWYVLFLVVVAVAATNTGNNALYMVLALMLAILVISGFTSRENVRGLDVEVEPPGEVFANRPFALGFTLYNRSRLFGRFFLLFSLQKKGQPLLVPHLPRRGRSVGRIEGLLPARGRHRLDAAHVASLFPFGFFRKGVRFRLGLEVLVFPEIFPAAAAVRDAEHPQGEEASRQAGWGYGLHALRAFRRGDDPRSIHWKQSARTGELVFMEREAETSRRLSILFDNAVGGRLDADRRSRFERLVSEAATAAVDHLARGYQVELVTRERRLPFTAGPRQRWAILETLALIEPCERAATALAASDPRAPQLRVHLEPAERERRAG